MLPVSARVAVCVVLLFAVYCGVLFEVNFSQNATTILSTMTSAITLK